jgi:hypothetical protein
VNVEDKDSEDHEHDVAGGSGREPCTIADGRRRTPPAEGRRCFLI